VNIIAQKYIGEGGRFGSCCGYPSLLSLAIILTTGRIDMKVVSLDRVPSTPMMMAGAEGVTKQVPLGANDGAPNFSFRVFTVIPGGHTPYHVHDSEHLNYVIQGEGVLVDEGKNEYPVRAGEFALVKPNEKHQYRNTSATEELKMICAVPLAYE
jgi:quercetin dioxygenase-like cupin family protein